MDDFETEFYSDDLNEFEENEVFQDLYLEQEADEGDPDERADGVEPDEEEQEEDFYGVSDADFEDVDFTYDNDCDFGIDG